jgi:hypothetical protein
MYGPYPYPGEPYPGEPYPGEPYPGEPVFVPAPAPPRRQDPLAVVVGNASLLSLGYWLLRQRALAVVTELVTLALVIVMVTSAQTWAEILVLVWWAAMVVHGWLLARRQPVRGANAGQRVAAVAVTVPVLLVVSLLRVHADGIGQTVADARRSGDCPRAVHALNGVWFGPRLVDAPLAAHDDKTADACRRLRTVQDQLALGLRTGASATLQSGFDGLNQVRSDFPGHEPMVSAVLTGFLAGLPTSDPCRTATVTDWLGKHQRTGPDRVRTGGVVARTAPAAVTGCGDRLMATHNWSSARTRYQQLVSQYPREHLAGHAKAGIQRATLAIQLATVRERLDTTSGVLPEYCDHPAAYSAAPPYRKGLNRALFYASQRDSGHPYDGDYLSHVPRTWRVNLVEHATLIVCADTEKNGTTVQTCPYENKLSSYFPTTVAFHKIAIPVRAYELRTGRRVLSTTVQIAGTSCPNPLPYTTFAGGIDIGPPGNVYVNASANDVSAAFRPVFVR